VGLLGPGLALLEVLVGGGVLLNWRMGQEKKSGVVEGEEARPDPTAPEAALEVVRELVDDAKEYPQHRQVVTDDAEESLCEVKGQIRFCCEGGGSWVVFEGRYSMSSLFPNTHSNPTRI
jgi:hypothetical protein